MIVGKNDLNIVSKVELNVFNVHKKEEDPNKELPMIQIVFQAGERGSDTETRGVLDGDLLSMIIERYKCFQNGPLATESNNIVLQKLEDALFLMKLRADERRRRGVLGTFKK